MSGISIKTGGNGGSLGVGITDGVGGSQASVGAGGVEEGAEVWFSITLLVPMVVMVEKDPLQFLNLGLQVLIALVPVEVEVEVEVPELLAFLHLEVDL